MSSGPRPAAATFRSRTRKAGTGTAASLVVLRGAQDDEAAGLGRGLHAVHQMAVQVHVAPAQGGDLSPCAVRCRTGTGPAARTVRTPGPTGPPAPPGALPRPTGVANERSARADASSLRSGRCVTPRQATSGCCCASAARRSTHARAVGETSPDRLVPLGGSDGSGVTAVTAPPATAVTGVPLPPVGRGVSLVGLSD